MRNTYHGRRKSKPTSNRRRSSNGNRNSDRRRSGNKSQLDPALFIQKAVPVEETVYHPERTIEQLPLSHRLISRLTKKGFKKPTEIQDKTLEALLDGRDLMGIAQTGTGKTGAFLMPIIEELIHDPREKELALVVVPTRELALQVNEEFRSMTQGLKLFSSCFIGGTSINKDIHNLRRSSHIVIGTPGRLLDLSERGALKFYHFRILVLDEFDRMLDMGFARDMDRIIGDMSDREQTMLFSATLDKSQERRISEILHDPVHVKVSTGDTPHDQIEQDVIRLEQGEDKFRKLCDMLHQQEFSKVLLFDETKHRVNRLCQQLNKRGIKSAQIQGNKSQNARQAALKSFKEGKIRVLVATDVAARGIDVSDISHVINYQMPRTYDSYIHRIGRTGRAGRTGKAFTFVS